MAKKGKKEKLIDSGSSLMGDWGGTIKPKQTAKQKRERAAILKKYGIKEIKPR